MEATSLPSEWTNVKNYPFIKSVEAVCVFFLWTTTCCRSDAVFWFDLIWINWCSIKPGWARTYALYWIIALLSWIVNLESGNFICLTAICRVGRSSVINDSSGQFFHALPFKLASGSTINRKWLMIDELTQPTTNNSPSYHGYPW